MNSHVVNVDGLCPSIPHKRGCEEVKRMHQVVGLEQRRRPGWLARTRDTTFWRGVEDPDSVASSDASKKKKTNRSKRHTGTGISYSARPQAGQSNIRPRESTGERDRVVHSVFNVIGSV